MKIKIKNLVLFLSIAISAGIIFLYAATLQGSVSGLDLYLKSLTEVAILTIFALVFMGGTIAQKYLRVALFAISIFFFALLVFIVDIKPDGREGKDVTEGIKIASFNKMGRNKDTKKVKSFLQKMHNERMQIIALQEVSEEELLTIDHQGMYLNYNKALATAIYSIWPIEEIANKNNRFHVVSSNGYIVVNVHMPLFSRGIKIYETKYSALLELLKQFEADKVIVLGDLNITKYDDYYRSLLQLGFIDSYSESGGGIGYTFPASGRRIGWLGAFLRIDYILVKNIRPIYNYRLDNSHGSDHYPIVTGLRGE